MSAGEHPILGEADVGVVGLAVMGRNLALNMADHGFRVAVHNRSPDPLRQLLTDAPPGSFGGGWRGRGPGLLIPAFEVAALVASLRRPRVVLLMVKAGGATDAVIETIAPLLDRGDVLIDGGNAHWNDTARRGDALRERGIRFVGSGVSGGEIGARFGPSLMAGCDADAWRAIEPIWTSIAAKVDARTGRPVEGGSPGRPVDAPNAESCAARVGPGASGHFVKMVHNGIEYADMQLIAEAYDLLRRAAGLEPGEIADVFAHWNRGVLDSYLVEITAEVLAHRDHATGRPFVDVVLDAAGQKGTGQWTSQAALDLGVHAPTVAEAVFARTVSADSKARATARERLRGPAAPPRPERERFIDAVGDALYCSKLCAYAQGFAILAAASERWNWGLDFASIARIWRGGCIIRARLLHELAAAFADEPGLPNVLLASPFAEASAERQAPWREVVAAAAISGVPAPAFSSALAWYDALRAERLPAALVQAQRDFFGAHGYERIDRPRGESYHVDWPHPDRPEVRL
ncbi:MAG: NADP-dependent phosphogluconate dehydrogenase [Phycisphaerales bacterium]|nr:NADP-dependent phosphogluconate dehydrogenase [Phycisphaerales bacterium]